MIELLRYCYSKFTCVGFIHTNSLLFYDCFLFYVSKWGTGFYKSSFFLSFFHEQLLKTFQIFLCGVWATKITKATKWDWGKKKRKKKRNICAWLYSASFVKNYFTDCSQKQWLLNKVFPKALWFSFTVTLLSRAKHFHIWNVHWTVTIGILIFSWWEV